MVVLNMRYELLNVNGANTIYRQYLPTISVTAIYQQYLPIFFPFFHF